LAVASPMPDEAPVTMATLVGVMLDDFILPDCFRGLVDWR
jgi:hypothetical protein